MNTSIFPPDQTAADIVKLLTTHRLSLSDEKILQVEIADVFEAAALDFEREGMRPLSGKVN